LPALARLRLANGLKDSTSASRTPQSLRVRHVLLALQVGLCLTLLVCAGLLLTTLRNLQGADLGFRPAHLLVFGIAPHAETPDMPGLYRTLLTNFRALPGVEGVTLMKNRLGSGWSSNASITVDGTDPKGDGNSHVRWNPVGPDYFHVLQASIVLGRDFTDADSATSQHVAIVNRMFVGEFLSGRVAVGHQIGIGGGTPAKIVGVVRDIKYTGTREESVPMAWLPYTQVASANEMQFEIRTHGDSLALLPELRGVLHQVAPDLPPLQPMTQDAQFEQSYKDNRIAGRLAVFFALLAALLVATGLYGTLAYTVSRRTGEIGLRMALGAARGQVIWMVLKTSLVVYLLGTAVGLPLAISGAHLLTALLFGIGAANLSTFVLAGAGLALIVLGASCIPARRAVSIDPLIALRHEC
jgi:predicted permease